MHLFQDKTVLRKLLDCYKKQYSFTTEHVFSFKAKECWRKLIPQGKDGMIESKCTTVYAFTQSRDSVDQVLRQVPHSVLSSIAFSQRLNASKHIFMK